MAAAVAAALPPAIAAALPPAIAAVLPPAIAAAVPPAIALALAPIHNDLHVLSAQLIAMHDGSEAAIENVSIKRRNNAAIQDGVEELQSPLKRFTLASHVNPAHLPAGVPVPAGGPPPFGVHVGQAMPLSAPRPAPGAAAPPVMIGEFPRYPQQLAHLTNAVLNGIANVHPYFNLPPAGPGPALLARRAALSQQIQQFF